MTIDKRYRLQCYCGCQQIATLPHFRVLLVGKEKRFVLPGCWQVYAEELAALAHLREVVTRCKGWRERVRKVGLVYRLQRRVHGRQEDHGRRTALRSALVYLLGTNAGLVLSRFWTK